MTSEGASEEARRADRLAHVQLRRYNDRYGLRWLVGRQNRRILDAMGDRARVLEVGAGIGNFLVEAASLFEQVSAVDVSVESARLARGRVCGGASTCVAQAECLPFPTSTFDAVVSNNRDYFEQIRDILATFPRKGRKRLFRRTAYGFMLDAMTHPLPYSLLTHPLIRFGRWSRSSVIDRFARADAHPTTGSGFPDALRKRPTETQCKLVWRGLQHVERERVLRERRARHYLGGLVDVDGIVTPNMPEHAAGAWTEFPIVVRNRDALYAHLLRQGRDVRYYYYRNCADLKIFAAFHRDCPNARSLMHNTLMLPSYPRYPISEIGRNIAAIREFAVR